MAERMMKENNLIFQLSQVSKEFRSGDSVVRIFDKLDLGIEEGRITCILGPSGCGKTTLARILAGLEKVTAGAVSFDGRMLSGPSSDRIMITQDMDLFDWMTVKENIEFGLRLRKEPAKHVSEVSARMLNSLNLAEYASFYPHEISSGMEQRVAMGRALAVNPKVLLMDEPVNALDDNTKRQIIKLILKVKATQGTTIIIVTHNVSEASVLADNIIVLERNNTTKVVSTLTSPLYGSYENRDLLFYKDYDNFKEKIYSLIHNGV